jgi:hypothetical protein
MSRKNKRVNGGNLEVFSSRIIQPRPPLNF